MSYYGNYDFKLMVARGLVPDHYPVNKFGNAPDGVQLTPSDIWPLSNSGATQIIWLAPTAARIHNIRSSSGSDTAAGVGARTVRIWGLKTWSTIETFEDVVMNGAIGVNTANSYVMINRMKVLTSGATSINVGRIDAIAATDGTTTAVILAGYGQTTQAILGIPSTQNLYLENYYFSLHDTANTKIDCFFLANENPDVQTTNFITKHHFGCVGDGSSSFDYKFEIPYKIEGPAIVKLQAFGSLADLDASATFDGYLITE